MRAVMVYHSVSRDIYCGFLYFPLSFLDTVLVNRRNEATVSQDS